MVNFLLKYLIILTGIFASNSNLFAENRIAFVLGVQSYQRAPLKNPINDARIISNSLQRIGFDVSKYTDLNYQSFRLNFSKFASKITPTSTVVFYFSGHGLQSDGVNILVPLGMDNASEAINLDKVMATLGRAKYGVKLVFIDACRSRPVTRSIDASIIKSVKAGLAEMNRPIGTIISFATAPGKVALDGRGNNSPYTLALAENIKIPGISINSVLGRTGRRVAQITNNRQISWYNSSLVDDFYLNGRSGNTEIASLGNDPIVQPNQNIITDPNEGNTIKPIIKLLRQKQYELSFSRTKRLAQTSNITAKRLLSTHYFKGWGTPKNIPAAMEILYKIGTKGDAKAAYYLSKIYFKGLHKRKRNIKKGIYWLEIAARNGHVKAQGIVKRLKK